MIERATVTQVIDDYHAKVRVPVLNKSENASGSTPLAELATAIVSVPGGIAPKIQRGDTVLLGFEGDDYELPVILGNIYNNRSLRSTAEINATSLSVSSSATLPAGTKMGKIDLDIVGVLEGLDPKKKLVDEFKLINSSISNITNKITDTIEPTLTAHTESLENIDKSIFSLRGTAGDTSVIWNKSDGTIKEGTLSLYGVFNSLYSHVKTNSKHVILDKAVPVYDANNKSSTVYYANHEHHVSSISGIEHGTEAPADYFKKRSVAVGTLYFQYDNKE